MKNAALRTMIVACMLFGLFQWGGDGAVQAQPLQTAIPAVNVNQPADVLIGENFTFPVIFDNSGDTTGYGPFIDLIFPTSGMDGDDGISFLNATYLGVPVETVDQVVTDTAPIGDGLGCVTHPYAKDASGNFIVMCGLAVGDHYVTLLLPFGSFVPNQTPAELTISASLSNLADLGENLNIRSSGGYMFGNDPLDNPTSDPSLVGAFSNNPVNPTLFTLTKAYVGPENETATGPNYLRNYTITVDVADGQTLLNFDLVDYLPDNIQYVAVPSSVPNYVFANSSFPATDTLGGQVDLFYNSIVGSSSANDLVVQIQFYVPLEDTDGNRVINPTSGDDAFSCNQVSGLGDWYPLDPRDAGAMDNAQAGSSDGICNGEAHENRLEDKSIAIQKSSAVVLDANAPGTSPGDVVEYTLSIQISDYFAFNNLVVADIFSDGQRIDPSFTPTLAVSGNPENHSGNFSVGNYNVDVSEIGNDPDPATDGSTTITFNISAQLAALAGEAWMVGGCIPMLADGSGRDTDLNPGLTPNCNLYNNGATTALIRFRTIIQNNFSDTYLPGDPSVDQGDVFTNSVNVSGDLLSVVDLSRTGYSSESDGSATSLNIGYGLLTKSIYSLNGNTTFSSPLRVAAGDVITYRFTYTLATSNFEGLFFIDYLPLPVFSATELSTFDPVQNAASPAAGHAKFGPGDTFFNYSGILPAITTNAAQNNITFTYGDYDNPLNQAKVIDIIFSVSINAQPFADGLYLTNQVTANEDSTNAGSNAENAIVQIQLTEPVLDFSKGVVWASSDQSNAVFTPTTVGPLPFSFNTANPSDCSRFSGTLSSSGLSANPVNSNLAGLDSGDIALMALVVENTGSGLNGAYDVSVRDSLPAGLTLVPASICAVDGSGAAIAFTGDLFGTGLELIDPGPTTTPGGALDPYDASSGRNIAVITYAVSVDATVAAGSTLVNTAALTKYAGTEGGDDHLITDLSDTAQIRTLQPSFDKAFTSTEIISAGNTNTTAVIGELVTYTLTGTVQEGLTPAAQVVDTLDSGLAFVDIVSVTASTGVSSSVMNFNGSGLCTNCTAGTGAGSNPLIANNGQLVTFNFGDVSNANSSNATPETITIVYRTVVLNVVGNQSGTLLNNSARFSYTGGSVTDSADNISVVEPNVTLTKTVQRTLPAPASAGPYDAGDQVTYTITIGNSGPIDAFDVSVRDQLPAALGGLSLASVTDSAGILTTSDFTLTAGLLTSLPASAFDLPANNGRSVILRVQGTIPATVTPNQAINNTASVAWTSLDGTVNDRSSFNPASDERTGADGVNGALNDYARNANGNLTVRNLSGTKYIVSSSEAGTADTPAPAHLTIGEIVRYRLAMQIPEGTSPDLAIFDRLSLYLQFLNDGTARYAFVSNSGLTSSSLSAVNIVGTAADPVTVPSASVTGVLPDAAISSSAATNTDVYASGTDIYFKLGTITNINDNDLDLEFIVVEFNALVLNVTENQAYNNTTGVPSANADRANDFQGRLNVATANTNMFTSSALSVRISEPSITNLTKTFTSPSPAQAEAGAIVTYSVTFSNASGANASPAYDVIFTDVIHPKLSLAPGSVITTSACAIGVSNNSTASSINISIDTLPTGCAVTVTYSATVRTTVIPGETLNNSARIVYSSLPGDYGTAPNPTGSLLVPGTNNPGSGTGERTASGGINDYVDTSLVGLGIFQVSPAKSLVSSSDPNTLGADLTIGETARYRLQVLLVQATSPNFTIRDYMPDYMEYLNDGLTQVALVSQNGITSSTLSGAGLTVVGDESNLAGIVPAFVLPASAISLTGNDPVFALGELRNNDNDPNNEYVVLEFNARMLNVSQNQLTSPLTTRSDTFTVSIDGIERPPSNSVTVNVVEPRIATSKVVNPTSGVQAGDTLTYTLTMTNTGTAPAYEVSFRDDLAQGVAYEPASMSCLLNGSASAATVTDNGTYLLVDSSPAGLWDIPVSQSLVCTYTATALSSLHADGNHTNTADADWSSLDNDPSYERDYDDTTPINVDGTQDTATAVFSVGNPTLAKAVDPAIATIGEVVTYTLTLSSPAGTIRDLVIRDTLPAGLIFSGSPTFTGLSTPVQTVSSPNDGTAAVNLSWDFGDEYIAASPVTITYQAIVANVVGNQQGDTLTNGANMSYTNAQGSPVTTATVTTDVDLVEPTLTIDKSYNSAAAPFDAGDTVIYTLVVSNTSGTTAYDGVVSDVLFGNAPTVTGIDSGTTGAVTTDTIVGGVLTVTIDQLDNGESITITVQVTLPDSVIPGQTIDNGAAVTWSSLPADNDPHERNGDDGVNGPLDDYAATDSTSFSIGQTAISKSMIGSSATHTAGTDLAIGEVGTFELLVTFPEGTITAPISIQDQMPAGLNLLAISVIDTSNFNAVIASGEPLNASTYGVGGLLKLNFATNVVVTSDNDDSNNVLRIVYSARMENLAANQNTVTMDNHASLTWGSNAPLSASPVTVTVVEPELQVSKTPNVTTPVYGQIITYNLSVSHLPTSTATAFQLNISDLIPAGLTYVAASMTAPAGWTMDDSAAPTLQWSCLAPACSLATNATAALSYQVSVDLPPAADPSDILTNNVNLTWTSLPDDPSNDRDGSGGINDYRDGTSANVTLTVPDLTISKDDGVTSYIPGDSLTYTIVVNNVGNGPALNAVVADTKPAHFSTWSWTCTQAGGATGCAAYSGAGDFANVVNVPAGGSITYTVTATILSSATGSLSNTATVTPEGGLSTDPTPGNNTATDVDIQNSQADLSVTKDDGVAVYTPGGSLTYTITVANSGPSDAPGALVGDTIPAQFSAWEWSCAGATSGASGCDPMAYSSVNFSNTVNLPAGSSITYTVTAQVASSANGVLTNTVTITPPMGITDPTPGNNTATDVDIQQSQADLSVVKDDGLTLYVPGGSLTYTITVSNTGPSDALNSIVNDPIPPQFSSWTWSCSGSTAGASGCDGVAASTTDFNDTVNLPAGSTLTYAVTAQIRSSASGSLTNTVTITPPAEVTDPTPGNNSASDVDNQDSQIDLSVTKDDGVDRYVPGESLTYTIVVTNAGPSDAYGALVSDTLPVQLSSWAWMCVEANGATGCDPMADAATNFTDTVDLPVGGSITYTVLANILSGASGVLTNTVSVTAAAGQTDTNLTNNSASDSDTQYSISDVGIVKSVLETSYVPGSTLTYQLLVTNYGASDATNVIITETVPDFTTFNGSAGWVCNPVAGTAGAVCTYSVGTLIAGNSSTVTFAVTIDNPIAAGVTEIFNATSVAHDGEDSDPSNNEDDLTVGLTATPDMTITKDDGYIQVSPGTSLTYNIVVSNVGDQAATGVVVVDSLPVGVTFESASDAGSYDDLTRTVTWNFAVFAGQSSRTLTLTVEVDDPFTAQTNDLLNNVQVSDDGSNGEDPTPENNEASDRDLLSEIGKLISDTNQDHTDLLDVAVGEIITYQVNLTIAPGDVNNQLENLVFEDILDRGFAFRGCSSITTAPDGVLVLDPTSGYTLDGLCTMAGIHRYPATSSSVIDDGRRMVINFGDLYNNSQDDIVLTIEYQVVVLNSEGNLSGTDLGNQATWSWDGGTLSLAAPQVTILEPKLEIAKSVNPTVALQGQTLTYTLRIRHTDISETDAFNVLLNDLIPPQLTYVAGSLTFVSGTVPTTISDINNPYLRIGWAVLPLSTQETVITYQVTLTGGSPNQQILNQATLVWTSLPGDVSNPQTPYNPYSNERTFLPGSDVNVYGASSRAVITIPALPDTGFEAGVRTILPAQPLQSRYSALGDLRFEIPKQNVNLPIVGVPFNKSGWDLTWLGRQIGYLEGTAYPTWSGNTGLTAHVYNADGTPGPFVNLHLLKWGDKVLVHAYGKVYTYEVRSVERMAPSQLNALRHENDSTLTLITCQGFDESKDTYTWRVVVKAVLVGVKVE
ncbi:MAG: hypothetical protein BGO78_11145 [Chloroflexi bacterium 44-23]|nr:MAG: hypothetical protein BGO78_11145 [Chloroflexi bacterium 44-23]